jgi:hypothetical protein
MKFGQRSAHLQRECDLYQHLFKNPGTWLTPGLGCCAEDVIKKLVQAKQGCDLNTSTFNQYLAYEVANGPWIKTHIQTIRETYKERRDVMLKGLENICLKASIGPIPRAVYSYGQHYLKASYASHLQISG